MTRGSEHKDDNHDYRHPQQRHKMTMTPNVSDKLLCPIDLKTDVKNPPRSPTRNTLCLYTSSMPASRSEKSKASEKLKASLKPQPAQRFRLLEVDHADEMEVDALVTFPAAPPAPAPPTPQLTPGNVRKALPAGLSFSKVVSDGTSNGTSNGTSATPL